MNQHDLDALGMRIKRICDYMEETTCLSRVWAEINERYGYFVKRSDKTVLAQMTIKNMNRMKKDIIYLKNDFEFPPSTRHNKNCKLL